MSTRVFQDTFVRANSAAGTPGNSWTDVDGGVWGITSDQMVSTNTFSLQSYGRQLIRPAGEVTQNGGKDQAAVLYHQGNAGAPVGSQDSDVSVDLRQQATQSLYQFTVDYANQSCNIQKFVAGTRTTIVSPTTFTGTVGSKVPYIAIFSAKDDGSSGTNLDAKLYAADGVTLLCHLSFTHETEVTLQAAGVLGCRCDYIQNLTTFEEWNFDGTDPTITPQAPSAGTPTVTATATKATLVSPATTGGTSPYTYQWYRSSTPLFTPGAGTLLSGATALTLNDTGLTPNTTYWYKMVVTDAASLTNTSVAVAAGTLISDAPIVFGVIGDSTWANIPHDSDNDLGLGNINLLQYAPPQLAGKYLEILTRRPITVANQAVGGTASSDYAPAVSGLSPASYKLSPYTSLGSNANVGTGQLLTALRGIVGAVQSAGYTGTVYVPIALGINDSSPTHSISAAAFLTNMQGIRDALIGNGFVPLPCYPTFIQDGADDIWGDTQIDLFQQYQSQIDSLSNGSTCLPGYKNLHRWGSLNINFFEGSSALTSPHLGVHPNADGGAAMALALFALLAQYLGLLFVVVVGAAVLPPPPPVAQPVNTAACAGKHGAAGFTWVPLNDCPSVNV